LTWSRLVAELGLILLGWLIASLVAALLFGHWVRRR